MPKPINDDTSLTIEDLQEALNADAVADAFGLPPKDQDELEPGPDMTHLGEEPEPVTEPEPEQVTGEEPVDEKPVEEPSVTEKRLAPEDLETMFVKGKVNGVEREYSLKELLAIKQTQDAASEFLERAKQEFKTEREAYRKEMEPQPKQVDEDYLTEEEKRDRLLEAKIKEIEQHQRNFETTQLTSEEERYMRSVFEKEGITEQQASERLKQIVDNYPDVAIFASELFTTNPRNADDLQRRKATFNTIWQLNKTIEMPEVVQRVAREAEEKGKNQAKIDAKRQLADTSAGQADMRDASRSEKLKDVAREKASDDAVARFLLDNSVVIKSFE